MTALPELTKIKSLTGRLQLLESRKLVNYHLDILKGSRLDLNNIAEQHKDYDTRRKAAAYLKKQDKLIEIAENLQTRINQLRFVVRHQPDTDELNDLILEIDLLNEMHFRVKQSYFSFLNTHFIKPSKRHLMVA